MKIMMKTILTAGIAAALGALGPARADTFTTGEFVTYDQAGWSQDPTAASLLQANFQSVYLPEGATMIVGVGYSIYFDSAAGVLAYVPNSGLAAALDGNLVDPTSSASGVFGANVTALKLDVDFSAAGLLGTSSTPLGSLVFTGLTGNLSSLNNQSVSYLLGLSEIALGGGSACYSAAICYTIADIDPLTAQVNAAFGSGTADAFAADYLAFPDTDVPATPLPAALPLFATGLGALGLLGWRRKRKAALAA
jgi:hypothetical protein